jgi:hypothetical protein
MSALYIACTALTAVLAFTIGFNGVTLLAVMLTAYTGWKAYKQSKAV